MTILVTTHYLDEAEQLCDRVAIVTRGRIVALDTPAGLLAGLGREIVELRVDGDVGAALAALGRQGVALTHAFSVGATIRLPTRDRPAPELVAAIRAAGVPTRALTTRAPTLDDVYLQTTGEPLAA
jgi:ABC-2 type transport system ATP-binding protein